MFAISLRELARAHHSAEADGVRKVFYEDEAYSQNTYVKPANIKNHALCDNYRLTAGPRSVKVTRCVRSNGVHEILMHHLPCIIFVCSQANRSSLKALIEYKESGVAK